MPIAFSGSKRIFFAHIPKTGGSSLEIYLVQRFGKPLGLRYRENVPKRGIISPTHHLTAVDLQDILRDDIDYAFAVVRNPLRRALSEYMFQASYGGGIPSRLSFSTWLRLMVRSYQLDPRVYRNHIRPQLEMIPEGSEVFRLEDGFAPIIARLDEVVGTTSTVEVGHHLKSKSKPSRVHRGDVELVHRLYGCDYDAFGYPRENPADYPDDRFATLRWGIALALAPLIVYRQRRRWLR